MKPIFGAVSDQLAAAKEEETRRKWRRRIRRIGMAGDLAQLIAGGGEKKTLLPWLPLQHFWDQP